MRIGKEVLMTKYVQLEQPSTLGLSGILVEQDTIFSIIVHNIRKVYCNNNMLYIGFLDESSFEGHTGGI
jgi:hypothetical protein